MSDFGGNDFLWDLAVQPDGKLVACSEAGDGGLLLTVRYGSDGALDPTFGTAGKTITDPGRSYAELFSVTIQPDGKIVASGHTDTDDGLPLVVLRYLGDGSVGINYNEDPSGHIALYPKPVNGAATTLELRDGIGAEVWTADLQGRMIGQTVQVPRGATSLNLDVKDLAAGIYLVNVLSQGITATLKIQVAK